MNVQPIGVFDSGLGGTSIWKEICKALPFESSIYLSDSKNAPYGEKSKQSIIDLSVKNTELLLEKNCKLIVVACNTATTNTINILRENYKIPFIGIEPAIKPAALQTKTGVVGILATKGTLASDLFHHTAHLYSSGIEVVEQVGEGLVQLIEQGAIHSDAMYNLLELYLKPMLDKNIDHLVLGCTHYPYLIPIIKRIVPASVKIIDSGEAVARQTKAVMQKFNLLEKNTAPKHFFYTNTDVDLLRSFLKNVQADIDINYLDF